jgi:tetratricopeptide (TPR) repeat protein
MPDRVYMVVDARQDHSFRIPRPDVSATTDSPNACNQCHIDEDAAWSLAAIKEWYGKDWPLDRHFGEAIRAGQMGALGSLEELLELIEQPGQASMVQATALGFAGSRPDPALYRTLFEKRADDEPLIRMAVASAATGLGARERLRLLEDPVLSVRQEAGAHLMDLPPDAMTGDQAATVAKAIEEFMEVQRVNADHSSGRLRLGYYYALRGEVRRFEEAYREAIGLEPGFVPAYANLADLYRQTGLDSEGEVVLRTGLAEVDAAALHHALGLLQVRTGKGSGGKFAAVDYRNNGRKLSLSYRFSLVCVEYSVGEVCLSHEELKNGIEKEWRYPGFSDDPLAGFRDLAQDLYVERVDPKNPANYLEGGVSNPFTVFAETI